MRLLGNRGFSLIELLVAASAAIILSLGAGTVIGHMAGWTKNYDTSSVVYSFKVNLMNNLLSRRAWHKTSHHANNQGANPESFACLLAGTDCAGKGGSFELYDAAGNLFYDPDANGGQAGFNMNGQICTTFDAGAGSSDCPFRYTLQWEPVCPAAGACIDPQVRVTAQFFRRFPDGEKNDLILNPENFNISLIVNATGFPPPVVGLVSVLLNQDESVTVFPLVNSWSNSGDPLTLSSIGTVAHGTLVNNGDGSVTYTPTAGYHGLDNFTFVVSTTDGKDYGSTVWLKVMTPFTWTGATGDGNWTTAGNWCGTVVNNACVGGVAPTSASRTIFDATCTYCDANINANVVARGVEMSSDFNGTLTQLTGFTFEVRDGGFRQAAGNFIGGSAASDRVSFQTFRLSGGTFTAPAGTLSVGRNVQTSGGVLVADINSSTATFNHNNGTFSFDIQGQCLNAGSLHIHGSLTVNNFIYNGTRQSNSCGSPAVLRMETTDHLTVLGNFDHLSGHFTQGHIHTKGNFTVGANANASMYGLFSYGTTYLDGTGNQTYSGAATGSTSYVVINKSSGTVTEAGGSAGFNTLGLRVLNGQFTAAATTMKIGGSTYQMNNTILEVAATATYTKPSNAATVEIAVQGNCWKTSDISIAGTLQLGNLILNGVNQGGSCGSGSWIRITSGVLAANGNVEHRNGIFVGGTIRARRNLEVGPLASTEMYGIMQSGTIILDGDVNQTYKGSNSGSTAILEIDKAAGSVIEDATSTGLGVYGFRLRRGSFTAPSANFRLGGRTFAINQSLFEISNGTTFTHPATGTVVFATRGNCSRAGLVNLNGNAVSVRNLTVDNLNQGASCGSQGSARFTAGDVLTVEGNFVHNDGLLEGGQIHAKSSVTYNAGADGGTTSIFLTGTAAQSITSYAGARVSGSSLSINNSAGVSLLGALTLNTTGSQGLTLSPTSTLLLNGFSLGINGTLNLPSGSTVTTSGGALTYGSLVGSGTIN